MDQETNINKTYVKNKQKKSRTSKRLNHDVK